MTPDRAPTGRIVRGQLRDLWRGLTRAFRKATR